MPLGKYAFLPKTEKNEQTHFYPEVDSICTLVISEAHSYLSNHTGRNQIRNSCMPETHSHAHTITSLERLNRRQCRFYRKNLKIGTPKIKTLTVLNIEQFSFLNAVMRLKGADGMANSVDRNQTAP